MINEMFLVNAREWWNEYDPMVLVVSEFTYDGKRVVVPFVVGPSLVEANLKEVPKGLSITDTVVAGLHPYTGGKLAITVVLARIKRSPHAKGLLHFVEGIASAFPLGAALQPHLKIAGALIDGVDTLLSMNDTELVVSHRWEYNDGVDSLATAGVLCINCCRRNASGHQIISGSRRASST